MALIVAKLKNWYFFGRNEIKMFEINQKEDENEKMIAFELN